MTAADFTAWVALMKTSRGPKPKPVEERLTAKLSPPDKQGCLCWEGARNKKGYGVLRLSPRNMLTHRLAWEIAHGPIPDGACVLHKCDNPACANPDHLFIGTRADNNADMLAKGRHVPQRNGKPPLRKGEMHSMAKLTWADARTIRSSSLKTADLARQFEVSASTIKMIRSGATWKE